jgi:hypothetical protein
MDNEWEIEEGIPQFGDPFIQQYLKGRDALIVEEQKRRHGNSLFPSSQRYTQTDLPRCKPPQITVTYSRPGNEDRFADPSSGTERAMD